MSRNPRFWRNVTLIALAHVALIAGLIRLSLAARNAPDAESLVWLSGAEDIAAGETNREARTESAVSTHLPEPKSLKNDKTEEESPLLATAKSEIELPTPKPTPVVASTPKPAAQPKPTPKPTPKKTELAKVTKSSVHPKSSPQKSTGDKTAASNEKKKSAKTVTAKAKSSADNGAGKTGSAGKGGGHAGGGTSA